MIDTDTVVTRTRRRWYFRVGIFMLCGLFAYAVMPPAGFPVRTILKVQSGNSLTVIAREAEMKSLVRSKVVLQSLIILFGHERDILAGDYYFDRPMNAIRIARMFADGNFNLVPVKLTFPEGFTRLDMARTGAVFLPQFDEKAFMTLTEGKEGYLFPDTYFVSPEITVPELTARLTENYEAKMAPLRGGIPTGRTESMIVTMASIVEKEAKGNEDRAIISGILWKRLASGMRLQVDAPFLYLKGIQKGEITSADLKIDSPYNTYLNAGLPPGPIGNPGEAAIHAAIYPKESPYLFYLHDNSGDVHYARTFVEHKANIKKYLK